MIFSKIFVKLTGHCFIATLTKMIVNYRSVCLLHLVEWLQVFTYNFGEFCWIFFSNVSWTDSFEMLDSWAPLLMRQGFMSFGYKQVNNSRNGREGKTGFSVFFLFGFPAQKARIYLNFFGSRFIIQSIYIWELNQSSELYPDEKGRRRGTNLTLTQKQSNKTTEVYATCE